MSRLLLPLAALLICLIAPASAVAVPDRLETGIVSPFELEGPEAALAVERIGNAGARTVRIPVNWAGIAPAGSERPPGFDAANPDEPRYRFGALDRQVGLLAAGGLEPLLSVYVAPEWASDGGNTRPDAQELERFAAALARRYDGAGVRPRVRWFQAWNEPNLRPFLAPQLEGGRSTAPEIYRGLVNGLAAGVKSVHADNLVVAGGQAPFQPGAAPDDYVTAPLRFMRELLCMRGRSRPRPSGDCPRTRFDVWSHHPYTTGGPRQTAVGPDDVSLGDLPEMKRLLDAAERAGRIEAPRRVRFWVTEFSWDTSPPDPGGVPPNLHARWVSEAMYEMWRSGVSLVTWFLLTDRPHVAGQPYRVEFQSGLYFRGGERLADARPKPALTAFRFPFVAFRRDGRIATWGRTPGSRAQRVVVERRAGGRWIRLATLRSGRGGLFRRRLPDRTATALRARVTGDRSLPFSLKPPPDRRFNPFGGELYTEGASRAVGRR